MMVIEKTGEVVLPKKRKTYKQNWPAYNEAQTPEKEHVEVLLKALCEGIEQPPRKPGAGRATTARASFLALLLFDRRLVEYVFLMLDHPSLCIHFGALLRGPPAGRARGPGLARSGCVDVNLVTLHVSSYDSKRVE